MQVESGTRILRNSVLQEIICSTYATANNGCCCLDRVGQGAAPHAKGAVAFTKHYSSVMYPEPQHQTE